MLGQMKIEILSSAEPACVAVGKRSLWLGDWCWIWVIADEDLEWHTLTLRLDCEDPPGPYNDATLECEACIGRGIHKGQGYATMLCAACDGTGLVADERASLDDPDRAFGYRPQKPERAHWLWFELDALGNLEDALEWDRDKETTLLQRGIAPGQPFLLRAHYIATKDFEGVVEVDIATKIMAVEPWPIEKVSEAWEAYWGRKHLMEGLW